MLKWFKRKKSKNKYPSITFTMLSDVETKIDVEWPYIDILSERNKELAEKTKISMVKTMAKTIVAMGKGAFTPFIQQRISENGVKLGDESFSVGLLSAISQYMVGMAKDEKDEDENAPIIKPYQVLDIRNMMLKQEGGHQ